MNKSPMTAEGRLVGHIPLVHGRKGIFVGRRRTMDVAFAYRMSAGFPGDVNRSHPANIVAKLNDTTNPLTAFGQAALFNPGANSVRAVLTSDSAITSIAGVTVRPYPFLPTTASGVYGVQDIGPALAPAGAIDILMSGFVMVPVSGSTLPESGERVYIWIAASTGTHVLGGFEAAPTSGSTIELDVKSFWNSPPDSTGIAELGFNI